MQKGASGTSTAGVNDSNWSKNSGGECYKGWYTVIKVVHGHAMVLKKFKCF